jgi:23S rRNA (uracil1939-C5)-methyltransferase
LELTVEKLIYGGDGLARLPADEHGRGKAVFLPYVLEGERVEAALVEEKPGFARARAQRVLQPSPQRVEPACPYFTQCGGCHYQHAAYEHQLAVKAGILRETLRRTAKVELPEEIRIHPSPPWNYRNRTRLRLQANPFALGYYRLNSHRLLAVEQCPISSPLINRALSTLWELGRAGKVAAGLEEVEFFADAEDRRLLVEVYAAIEAEPPRTLAQELAAALPEVAVVAWFRGRDPEVRPEVLAGEAALTYATGRASYRVSPGAFFQTNRHLTDELVEVVTAGRSGVTALDLYAGVGLFSAVLAGSFERVLAVEPAAPAYADLKHNVPATVKCARATTLEFLERKTRSAIDLVVVDPPRAGLGEQVVGLLGRLTAPRLTYVSCDPATLSRDLRGLLELNFKVEQVHLVDLFPQTFHIESVLHLAR